ncbi:auxin-responsive protein SAUR71-like [Cucurbita moschata]|uniref:Auxin-responsive protein SAUR71-like n=1 Tax=Cucurbita moschata TaxID=3662 RepID=A0A6J1E7S2_CUCMO|nr:auxin-responsive protein SAUR71-like [Cucurbita moschata]
MEATNKKWSKHMSFKGLVRSRSVAGKTGVGPDDAKKKSKFWRSGAKLKHPVAPEGCFAVYVGPERERFVVKTEFANHPLFQMLLEDAEEEYGYNSQGPIWLPCEVGLFYNVLAEMDGGDGLRNRWMGGQSGGLLACSPLRLTSCGSRHDGGYRVLSPSSMLKLNGL